MSHIAKHGNKAEKLFCESSQIKAVLESYMKKPIQKMSLIAGKKKTDILITFEDSTTERIQNKDGKGNNRGWSCDRRSLDKFPIDEDGKNLLGNVCLKKGTDRPSVLMPSTLIKDLLMGSEVELMPTYFTHSIFDRKTGELIGLSICPSETMITFISNIAYSHLLPKRTCVHISPLMYLQRKGGGKTDKSPDDIQLKFKSFPSEIMTHLV